MGLLKIPKDTPFFTTWDEANQARDCVCKYISTRLHNSILAARFCRESCLRGEFTAGDILKMSIVEFKNQKGVGQGTFFEFLTLLDSIEKE